MTSEEHRCDVSSQGDNLVANKGMATTLKKLQSEMEMLKSRNEALQKEFTTAKSRSKTASKKTVQSVVRRLNIDEGEDADRQESERERLVTAMRMKMS